MRCRHAGHALILLATGSYNTLSAKWADTMTSESADGQMRNFSHPFLQVWIMFVGEMACMVVYIICWRNKGAK